MRARQCRVDIRFLLGGLGLTLLGGLLWLPAQHAAKAAPTEIHIPGNHAFPESITSTSDGTLYISSLGDGMIFRAAPGSATAEPFVPQGPNLMSVIGVLADEKSGTLWACSSDLTGAGVTAPGGGSGPPALKAFDLKSGAPKKSITFPGGTGFCNDIAIGRDGAAYVTDTINPRILRLKPGASEFEVWIENPVFGTKGYNLDGIAFGGDGHLYVNTYEGGKLFRVAVKSDGSAGEVTEIEASMALDHPDGLRLLKDNTFLMIEGAGRLDRITIDGRTAKTEVLKDGMKGPVAVTQVGDTAWALEGQLGVLFDPAQKGTSPTPFRAIAVALTK
jgi:sugar lactone lactonase YvrE